MPWSERQEWMCTMAAAGLGAGRDSVVAALKSKQFNPALTAFIDGSSPNPFLFVVTNYVPPEGDSPRDVSTDQPAAAPVVAHDGTGPYMMAGMSDTPGAGDAMVYFLRTVEGKHVISVDIAQDTQILYHEVKGNVTMHLATMLRNATGPMCQTLGLKDTKAQPEHLSDFMAALDRLAQELEETVAAVSHTVDLKMPDAEIMETRDKLTEWAAATRGKKLRDFEELVGKCTTVLMAWCESVDKYVTAERETPPSPFAEVEYWRCRLSALTSIANQLQTKKARYIHQVLLKSNDSGDAIHAWKAVDLKLTEATNEAKDNLKYLLTLERYLKPLRSKDPKQMIEAMPGLFNAIKMIFTIARYYGTGKAMTTLLTSIATEVITQCSEHLVQRKANSWLWEDDPGNLVGRLNDCQDIKHAFEVSFRDTKDAINGLPHGRPLDVDELAIFGKLQLFGRRIAKLTELFTTVRQFTSLKTSKIDDIEFVVEKFASTVGMLSKKQSDVLEYTASSFDRDYVQFKSQVEKLDKFTLDFIDKTFEDVGGSITKSLDVLVHYQHVFEREVIRSALDRKFVALFYSYGEELEEITALYERERHAPPIARNLPPVAGNIQWSKLLLERAEAPMQRFDKEKSLSGDRNYKRIIKSYNKLVRTLVAFEILWFQAWCQAIDKAKSGLSATLIVRHPDDENLYVNFDADVFQLIREAKCLERMRLHMPMPEAARVLVLQEARFKRQYGELTTALSRYDEIVSTVIPVTAMLLRSHFQDTEQHLRPGMVTLTWTSMNVEPFIASVKDRLIMLGTLIETVNDIIETRIERHLRVMSKTVLVDLPTRPVTMTEFVDMQDEYIVGPARTLAEKNLEVERAVGDLIQVVKNYPLVKAVPEINQEDVDRLQQHYNHFLYQALLHSAKNSLVMLKAKISGGGGGSDESDDASVATSVATSGGTSSSPFFELDVELVHQRIALSPSLEDVQACVNTGAFAILKVLKTLFDWGQSHIKRDKDKVSFFDQVTGDFEIVRVVLLLNGSIQAARAQGEAFLEAFDIHNWLWTSEMDAEYDKFMETEPTLNDYEEKFKYFGSVMDDLLTLPECTDAACCRLNIRLLKEQVDHLASDWKVVFAKKLQNSASQEMQDLLDYIAAMEKKLGRKIKDLASLQYCMINMKEIRENETNHLRQIGRLKDTFSLLVQYLPEGAMSKEELDANNILDNTYKEMADKAEDCSQDVKNVQGAHKRQLVTDVTDFVSDVDRFRKEWSNNGPMGNAIAPDIAIERLGTLRDKLEIRERKVKLYQDGQQLFKLPVIEFPDIALTRKEVSVCDGVFGVFTDVSNSIDGWKELQWSQVLGIMEDMMTAMDGFAGRAKRMPKRVRDWPAAIQVKTMVDNFLVVLPMMQELSKESIRARHWEAVLNLAGQTVPENTEEWLQQVTFRELVEMNLQKFEENIIEVTDMADKERKIELDKSEMEEKWFKEMLQFKPWKDRGVPTIHSFSVMVDELDEATMMTQTMLTMKAVAPFKESTAELLKILSDTADVIDRWVKVQMMWCSLESVFTGGDIAKQLPKEAKIFGKVDKDFMACMGKAEQAGLLIDACANEQLRASLPVMFTDLEKCQRSLEGYLEQKRDTFPRFYFASDAILLQILSQGSDPKAMNAYYDKVFDGWDHVNHDKKDPTIILDLCGYLDVPFSTPILARGNIEDWLNVLLQGMRQTMKDLCRLCAGEILTGNGRNSNDDLRVFVDHEIAQFALLGIQILWTDLQETALDESARNKKAMNDNAKFMAEVLRWLSSWCLQDLGSKNNRKKIETLVTVHVHQKDVSRHLKNLYSQGLLSLGKNDFEWLQQARFYWDPKGADDCTDDGAMNIYVADWLATYQYEFLGAKERLVITPLTDRCYITLGQALGMYFGGAPAGPAGTGKTETTKDLCNTIGLYIMVQNCGDQMRYKDCAKIFKGLCKGGIWGCFDEFNRITLPVLSVVAQQVQVINNAKRMGMPNLTFPGDPQIIACNPVVGYFITMNPGYAGRQELPENLKALFRGMMMMVPNFELIMAVKLCSQGYDKYEILATKFFQLYETCKLQLSKQRHYDWGLRNILAVLRTCGSSKRDTILPDGSLPKDKPEEILLYQTLRDMNLSKMVAQDVPLFLSLLQDLFPQFSPPAKAIYPALFEALPRYIEKHNLVYHEDWVLKMVQLYETTLVRHGIMLVGPSGGGKSNIFNTLMDTLIEVNATGYRMPRMNPKAVRPQEMYGETDPQSQEWVKGVFASIWERANNKANPYWTWIMMDGPVDAIWIEDLNTVLDDNKILTLANGDRFPMTDNAKIMFEVETLKNASPATVSRAGIIYVSDTDLDWGPMVEGIIRLRPETHKDTLRTIIKKYAGDSDPIFPGEFFNFITRNTKPVMATDRVGNMSSLFNLMRGLIDGEGCPVTVSDDPDTLSGQLEKVFLYCLAWSGGGLLEPEDRIDLDEFIRKTDKTHMPPCGEGETIFEWHLDQNCEWAPWDTPKWVYPNTEKLDFANLLVPTMDSTRALYAIKHLHKNSNAVLMVGSPGTAKTSTALMFFESLAGGNMLVKTVNFSSATLPKNFQDAIEADLEKRGGKTFGPPVGKMMTVFVDDISMPEVNKWGDQITNEMVRILIEQGGFPFLDKDRRGDWKIVDDMQYIAAMGTPGGGKNDIPNRLKRQFFKFNMVLPSITSINDIYGQMLAGRFPKKEFDAPTMEVVNKMTTATISLWDKMKMRMLPTPAKFHYVFNMRDLSRVFQGVLLTPKSTFHMGGGIKVERKEVDKQPPSTILMKLWRHENERVFGDKLTNHPDKNLFMSFLDSITSETFGQEALDDALANPLLMVSCLRDDVFDEDEILVEKAPKVYESGGTLLQVRATAMEFLGKFNEENPQKQMELILFDDALKHLLRISRYLEMPRGSGLLVGVGGSGKQSLTRLASYISRSMCCQIVLTKTYGLAALEEDLRVMYRNAGWKRQPTTFLFTDSEIKDETFLEKINTVLMTGNIAGLFAKDEVLAITADLQGAFIKERPDLQENTANIFQFFIDNVRDNLHVILCFSPMNPMFPVRARKFPGLFSCPTVDYFLPWPQDALISVSRGFIEKFELASTKKEKECLIEHMGICHSLVVEVCEEYFTKIRRQVFQTPKSYLSFIGVYKVLYRKNLDDLQEREDRLRLGLEKLIGGAEDVAAMEIVLADEQIKLQIATDETNQMLEGLQASSAQAQAEGDAVAVIKASCEADAERIGKEKAACEKDLAQAQPFVDMANSAIDSIKPGDINDMKANKKPVDILKLIFDGLLILFMLQIERVKPMTLNIKKLDVDFMEPSFTEYGIKLLGSATFLTTLQGFGKTGKDLMNEETVEFLFPYLDLENFTPETAKSASSSATSLCIYVQAMKEYYYAAKIVRPKLEALGIALASLDEANRNLAAAEKKLEGVKAKVAELQNMFENQMAEKKRIEDGANALQKKAQQASDLIGGLAGEQKRWGEDADAMVEMKRKLVGDCAVTAAFVSYCGPFNQEFRNYMIKDKFIGDCIKRKVPVTENLNVISFTVDPATIADWNMEGLPTDPLSIQNGILITQASRFPLLIDPQGQALSWIKSRELERTPYYGTTTLAHPKLKDQLEYGMAEGKALIITAVENELDPMFDPVLEKQFIKRGGKFLVNVSDKMMEYNMAFTMYFISRLPNPSFSPELQAKTCVVDFTVTQLGLEEQLLGKVIGKEQKALEEQLEEVLNEVNQNTKTLLMLDAALLEKLTSNTGSLLEDEDLIEVLQTTKKAAKEVGEKLAAADETKKNIGEKREQFRPVATRGSVIYFTIVEMSGVNCMYQTSLVQFVTLFMSSMDVAEKAALASKRVNNIIASMTYLAYRYINKGLYEAHKLTFLLVLCMKIMVTAGLLTRGDVGIFLRAGGGLDRSTAQKKPFKWMTNEDSWYNILELSRSVKFFATLPTDMARNESMWQRWYDDDEPEQLAVPDFEDKFAEFPNTAPFLKLILVRSIRLDRTELVCKEFLAKTEIAKLASGDMPIMGPPYVEPVTDTIDMVFEASDQFSPTVFLLSKGVDPTESIETLARKMKLGQVTCVSLGEGQEPVGIMAIESGAANGTWVMLQNCELGLGLMDEMEERLLKIAEDVHPSFRLWLTAMPHPQFPLALLQMSVKVTNEPPAGLKAGVFKSYTVMVDQDKLERIDGVEEGKMWRKLLFALCFMHSCVQERRKFGALGWCIPYEYNQGDQFACMTFLEKHLYNGPISWPTVRFMVSEVQYGGKITDSLDRRLFNLYTDAWITEATLAEGYTFQPKEPILKIPQNFQYTVPDFTELAQYQKYALSFPEVDSPEVLGLHPNADLTYRQKSVNALLGIISMTQPKGGGGGGGGPSMEDLVYEQAGNLSARLPPDYIEDDYKAKMQKLGGLTVPLNMFLFQEIQRFQEVLAKVRFMLKQMQLAIKGEVVMTDELAGAVEYMGEAKAPHTWIYTASGTEFSWIIAGIAGWFSMLLSTAEQDTLWLETGRPKSFWFAGFSNPPGFLTAMQQEVTRRYKAKFWALDDMRYHTEVTTMKNFDAIGSAPEEGVYLHGLTMDGGDWDLKAGLLVESVPKILFTPLPVLYASANHKREQDKVEKVMFGPQGPYQAPLYKYVVRGDGYPGNPDIKNFVFKVNLKCTPDKPPLHWGLRGLCLLCNT